MVPTASLTSGAIMQAPIASFTTGGASQAYLLLNLMEGIIKKRKEELRERLLGEAEVSGSETETGSFKLDADGNTVIRERRESHKLKDEAVSALLEKHGLTMEQGFDKVVTWVPSPTKLAHLVEIGALTKEAVDDLTEVGWAIKVVPSDAFAKLIDEAKQNLQPPQLESGTKKSKTKKK